MRTLSFPAIMLKLAAHHVSRDPSRPLLHAIHLHRVGLALAVTGTDGMSVLRARWTCEHPEQLEGLDDGAELLLVVSPLIVLRLKSKGMATITQYGSVWQISFDDSTLLLVRAIDGPYPPVDCVIPSASRAVATHGVGFNMTMLAKFAALGSCDLVHHRHHSLDDQPGAVLILPRTPLPLNVEAFGLAMPLRGIDVKAPTWVRGDVDPTPVPDVEPGEDDLEDTEPDGEPGELEDAPDVVEDAEAVAA